MNLTDKQFFVLIGGALLAGYLVKDKALSAINPNDPDNVVYQGANGVVQTLTGRKLDKFGRPLTLGAWLAGG